MHLTMLPIFQWGVIQILFHPTHWLFYTNTQIFQFFYKSFPIFSASATFTYLDFYRDWWEVDVGSMDLYHP